MPVPEGRGDTALAFELLVQLRQARTHLDGRFDGAEGVVFVRNRDPESGHDRVADELVDRAAVALEHRMHFLEVALHDAANRFRIQLLAQARGARDVREDDGDGFPRLDHKPSVRLA